MQPEEPALSPEMPVTVALPRRMRVGTVRPPEPASPREAPVEAVPAPVVVAEAVQPEESAALPEPIEVAAPRREVRLVAKTPVTEEERLAARRERKERERAEAEAANRPALEKKLASLYDAGDMLRVMDTELVMRRAQRLQGDGGNSRQALRVLTVTTLFALLIAALWAMSWMQDRLARTGISRHRAETVDKK